MRLFGINSEFTTFVVKFEKLDQRHAVTARYTMSQTRPASRRAGNSDSCWPRSNAQAMTGNLRLAAETQIGFRAYLDEVGVNKNRANEAEQIRVIPTRKKMSRLGTHYHRRRS